MKKLLIIAILFSSFANAQDTTNVTLPVGVNIKFDTIKVIDKVTNNQVQAGISNVVIQNNNPDFAALTFHTGGVIKIVRVSSGSGTATVSCNVSYTDPGDGLQKNETKTILITYTVIGAPHGVKLSLTFN